MNQEQTVLRNLLLVSGGTCPGPGPGYGKAPGRTSGSPSKAES